MGDFSGCKVLLQYVNRHGNFFTRPRIGNLGNVEGYVHRLDGQALGAPGLDVEGLQARPTGQFEQFVGVDAKTIGQQEIAR